MSGCLIIIISWRYILVLVRGFLLASFLVQFRFYHARQIIVSETSMSYSSYMNHFISSKCAVDLWDNKDNRSSTISLANRAGLPWSMCLVCLTSHTPWKINWEIHHYNINQTAKKLFKFKYLIDIYCSSPAIYFFLWFSSQVYGRKLEKSCSSLNFGGHLWLRSLQFIFEGTCLPPPLPIGYLQLWPREWSWYLCI